MADPTPAAEPLEARTLLALTALGPLADAYVRDGMYAATNFGTAAALDVKSSTVADNTRIMYLKFDLAAFTNPASVKLRLHGALSPATPAVSLAAKGVANTAWSESTITYNNRPDPSVTVLATQTISGATAQWYEWDVTTYARSRKRDSPEWHSVNDFT